MRSLVIGSTAAAALALTVQLPALGAGYQIVDLHNPAFLNSTLYGSSSGQQVGFVSNSTNGTGDHAALWSDSAASFVDLHPAGFASSDINATDGVHQVGSVFRFDGTSRGALWS